MRELLQQLITDSITTEIPQYTKRDAHLPAIPGKALAVIGMRRSGKTTFLWQCLAQRLVNGTQREALLYLNFEDERLTELQATDLQWIVEDYYRLAPYLRSKEKVTFFFDEIQVVAGWETFARRLMDTENVELFLTGSSARLLSQEVATAMRGRAMEVLIHPFSFREVLRHAGVEPSGSSSMWSKALRTELDSRLRDYLVAGGFPESQGVPLRDRRDLLRSYVDVAILRDVIERHNISNPVPLRWLQRHLLASPAAPFSIQKFYAALRSQGIRVGKDTLYTYLDYLEDTFLIRIVSQHSASERKRAASPRKAYPVDPALIAVYEKSGRANLGQALETVILIELERRGYEVFFANTQEGYEIDFLAQSPEGEWHLMQICADLSNAKTREREVRALLLGTQEYPYAMPLLITLDAIVPQPSLPEPIQWQSAASWLLG